MENSRTPWKMESAVKWGSFRGKKRRRKKKKKKQDGRGNGKMEVSYRRGASLREVMEAVK